MKISVALAAYNGEKFIEEQIRSILCQLGDEDEVIVSDDNPEGKTRHVVCTIAEKDSRVKYFKGPGKGVIKNFEYAIGLCSGDVVFLSDQDDVWLPGKVDAVCSEIENGAVLVLHNAAVTDAELNVTDKSFFDTHGSRKGYAANILRNSYMGCCMAFDRCLKAVILPFPESLPMHDQYIGLMAEKYAKKNQRKVAFISTPYIYYRQHGNNVTGGATSLRNKIIWRVNIISKTLFK